MSKRETYAARLEGLVGDGVRLEAFLLKNSGLPGRRANIELAAAFADTVARAGADEELWATLKGWAALWYDEAPTNSRREFLPFSAVQALGGLYCASDDTTRDDIFAALRAAARSERWRTREAAAFAFQRIGERDFGLLRELFSAWLERSSRLERRAILASLAHPPVLEGPGGGLAAEFALSVAGEVLAGVRKLTKAGRSDEEFRVLKKGLGYAISVFVAAAPEEGFRFLRKWAEADDADVKRIVAANIRKSRLAKRFPEQCAEVGEILSWGTP
ncbi:MAG: hypothetical protein ACYTKD_26990 [Planctomycetota bacterium]